MEISGSEYIEYSIELSCDTVLKDKFDKIPLINF